MSYTINDLFAVSMQCLSASDIDWTSLKSFDLEELCRNTCKGIYAEIEGGIQTEREFQLAVSLVYVMTENAVLWHNYLS